MAQGELIDSQLHRLPLVCAPPFSKALKTVLSLPAYQSVPPENDDISVFLLVSLKRAYSSRVVTFTPAEPRVLEMRNMHESNRPLKVIPFPMIPGHMQFTVGMQYHIDSSDSVRMVSLSLSYSLQADMSDTLLAGQPDFLSVDLFLNGAVHSCISFRTNDVPYSDADLYGISCLWAHTL